MKHVLLPSWNDQRSDASTHASAAYWATIGGRPYSAADRVFGQDGPGMPVERRLWGQGAASPPGRVEPALRLGEQIPLKQVTTQLGQRVARLRGLDPLGYDQHA